MKHTGGGKFKPGGERNFYFIAAAPSSIDYMLELHSHMLIAVNEIRGKNLYQLERVLNSGASVLIDSGIFWLTNEHKRAHGMTMDQALALAPDEIDGFNELLGDYVDVCGKYGDRSWGYIELDQGGRENKIKTRTKLEKAGLHPIPVYHPLNDGWDYFDYLAERYDRICFGNIVQADRFTRIRLIATAYERKRKFPHLWIHLLGFTPNQWMNAFPIDSADSSTWTVTVKWGGYIEKAAGQSLGHLNKDFQYMMGAEVDADNGHRKGWMQGAYAVHFQELNWQSHINRLQHVKLLQDKR
jgi:hypothetical protein